MERNARELADFYVSKALSAKYVDVATTALLIYDWITALPEEIDLVWRAPPGQLLKYIFIILRYTTLSAQPISLLNSFLTATTEETCYGFIRAIISMTYVILASSETIIILRLLSVHRKSRNLFRVAWALFISSMIGSAVVIGLWANNLHMIRSFVPISPGEAINALPGCWSAVGTEILFVPFALIIAWEILVCIANVWKTWQIYVKTGTPFWVLFYRYGVHFYCWIIVISAVTVALIITFVQRGSFVIQDRIIFSVTRNTHSVCVARLLLHIRREGKLRAERRESSQSTPFTPSTKDFYPYPPLTRSGDTSLDSQSLTSLKSGGKRVRSRWEEMRRQKQEPDIIEIEAQTYLALQPPVLEPPPSSTCFIDAGRDSTGTPPEEPGHRPRVRFKEKEEDDEMEMLREWIKRVNTEYE